MRRRVLALLVLVLTLVVAMMAFSGLASAQETAHGCEGMSPFSSLYDAQPAPAP